MGAQEFVILLVILAWWWLPIAYIVRTAQRRGGYTPWVAIVVMILLGWMASPFFALMWRFLQGPKLRPAT